MDLFGGPGINRLVLGPEISRLILGPTISRLIERLGISRLFPVQMVGNISAYIYKRFPRCAQLGAMLRYLERDFSGAIVMKRSFFEE